MSAINDAFKRAFSPEPQHDLMLMLGPEDQKLLQSGVWIFKKLNEKVSVRISQL